jgi:hypothetical protein
VEVTHYERLGVERSATHRDIRTAYLRLARQTHPDLGGDPDAFAALAEAWRVLSSRGLRERYDAGLDGDDDEWGEAVGFDAPAPAPRPTSTAGGDEDPHVEAEPDRPTESPEPVPPSDGRTDRVDPFRSGPRALPPVVALVGDAREPRAFGRRHVLIACAVVAVGIVVTALLAAHPGVVSESAMFALTMYVLALSGLALGVDAARRARWRAIRVVLDVLLWGSIAFYGLVAATYATEPVADAHDRAVRITFVTLPFLAGVALGVLLEVRALRTRRSQRASERAVRLHREATAWNELLAALKQTRGARLVRREVDPRGRPRPVWVVLAPNGASIVWVSDKAPSSWVTVLRASGVDVHDPRENPEA